MNDEQRIAALNELISASKDTEKAMSRAADDSREPDLVRALGDAEAANRLAWAELQDQARVLGSTTEQGGSFKAAARRSWASIKSMVIARNDSAIVEECVRGQGDVRASYADALDLDLLEPLHYVVERHHRVIVSTHYRLLELRNRMRDDGPRATRAND